LNIYGKALWHKTKRIDITSKNAQNKKVCSRHRFIAIVYALQSINYCALPRDRKSQVNQIISTSP